MKKLFLKLIGSFFSIEYPNFILPEAFNHVAFICFSIYKTHCPVSGCPGIYYPILFNSLDFLKLR